MWLKNCWYVIAWEHEIDEDALFTRRVLNEPILVFRTRKGDLTALEDRCCHRYLPLSLGRVSGENLQCGYHGLEFDAMDVSLSEAKPLETPHGGDITHASHTSHTSPPLRPSAHPIGALQKSFPSMVH